MRPIYIILLVLLISSCSPKFIFHNKVVQNPVTIGTEGVVIEAEDGSFKWEYGENYDLKGIDFQTHEWFNSNSLNLKTDYLASLNKEKAIKVIVTTPFHNKPLYGLLEINSIYQPCVGTSPETRSYYIQVPKSYVDAALGGKVSVVYESYKCRRGYFDKGKTAPSAMNISTWVLWLSDRPLTTTSSENLNKTQTLIKKM